jgi:predicted protein tyrosine phosphatase
MPTITIKNGNRTLKLTKRERENLVNAMLVCKDIRDDFPAMRDDATTACDAVADVLLAVDKMEGLNGVSGKPTTPAGK